VNGFALRRGRNLDEQRLQKTYVEFAGGRFSAFPSQALSCSGYTGLISAFRLWKKHPEEILVAKVGKNGRSHKEILKESNALPAICCFLY